MQLQIPHDQVQPKLDSFFLRELNFFPKKTENQKFCPRFLSYLVHAFELKKSCFEPHDLTIRKKRKQIKL